MDGYLDSDCARLDISMLRRAGTFDLEPEEVKEGRFLLNPDDPAGGVIVWGVEADEQGRPEGVALLHKIPGGVFVEQAVWLTTTPCNYGGVRYWFLCPAESCGRRVRVLYLPPGGSQFACRHCAGIICSVTRETASERLARREAKLQARLGGADPLGGPRPKSMHRKTFMRLSTLHTALSLERHTQVLDAMLQREGLAGMGSDPGTLTSDGTRGDEHGRMPKRSEAEAGCER